MAHNIWSGRFYGHREAAWHKLGVVNDRVQTAAETLELLGDYKVETVPLFYMLGGEQVESDYRLIVREATADDPQPRVFGSPVHSTYELISPYEAAKMWDKKTGAPVETMAMLSKGDRMFICAALPTFDVGGFDQVRNYLMFFNPMRNGEGAAAYVTSIRTVCENTLRAGIAAASQSYTISHRQGGRKLLGDWLSERWGQAQMLTETLREAYDIMAKKRVSEIQVRWIAEELYPLPAKPDRNRPRLAKWSDVRENWERDVEKAKRLRSTVVDLFSGAGTGLDDPRLRGTKWSAWNAVAEVESYRKFRQGAIVMSLTNGDRANRIMQAQTMLLNINSSTRRNDVKLPAYAG